MKLWKKYRASFGLNDYGRKAVEKAGIVAGTLDVQVYLVHTYVKDSGDVEHSLEIVANPIELRFFTKKLEKVLGIYVNWEEQ